MLIRKVAVVFLVTLILAISAVALLGVIFISHNSMSESTNEVGDGKNIHYGSHRQQVFDFYAPTNASNTLVILVHGGAWIAGDKNYMSEIAQYFADEGYSVVNMNYRLALVEKYPAPLEDLAMVINYIETNKTKFKLQDNYQIILIGHSAGAHISTLYGLKESEFGTRNVDKIVGIAGPYDFVVLENQKSVSFALNLFLGQTSKKDASPVWQIKDNETTNYLLVHGMDDELVPLSQLTSFETALNSKNVPVETLIVENRNHNSILSQMPKSDIVADRITTFIEE
ncbi:MAG: alpha/beta hydrolase [Candidatus Micrarchaeota archaeon]